MIDKDVDSLHYRVKDAFGGVLQAFFNECISDTAAVQSWLNKPYAKAVMVAPERMQDDIQAMLDKYRQLSSPTQKDSTSSLPVMIVAFSKSWQPVLGEYGRQIAAPLPVIIDNDPKERVFKLKLMMGSVRCQVVILAAESPTTKSIISQFCLFMGNVSNRTFHATHRLGGINTLFPVKLADPDLVPVDWDSQTKNLYVSYVDLEFKVSIPMLITPKVGEPNDGKGTDGDKNDPHGFALPTNFVLRGGVIGNG